MLEIVRHYLQSVSRQTGKGQGLVEYALILALISVAAIAILNTLGTSITSVFSTINGGLAV